LRTRRGGYGRRCCRVDDLTDRGRCAAQPSGIASEDSGDRMSARSKRRGRERRFAGGGAYRDARGERSCAVFKGHGSLRNSIRRGDRRGKRDGLRWIRWIQRRRDRVGCADLNGLGQRAAAGGESAGACEGRSDRVAADRKSGGSEGGFAGGDGSRGSEPCRSERWRRYR
jgi:hypothetical protein